MKKQLAIEVDAYILSVLMRDIVGHDRTPATYLVYLHLFITAQQRNSTAVQSSLQMIADATGLSKASVHNALIKLRKRRLVESQRESATSIPVHTALTPWRR